MAAAPGIRISHQKLYKFVSQSLLKTRERMGSSEDIVGGSELELSSLALVGAIRPKAQHDPVACRVA